MRVDIDTTRGGELRLTLIAAPSEIAKLRETLARVGLAAPPIPRDPFYKPRAERERPVDGR